MTANPATASPSVTAAQNPPKMIRLMISPTPMRARTFPFSGTIPPFHHGDDQIDDGADRNDEDPDRKVVGAGRLVGDVDAVPGKRHTADERPAAPDRLARQQRENDEQDARNHRKDLVRTPVHGRNASLVWELRGSLRNAHWPWYRSSLFRKGRQFKPVYGCPTGAIQGHHNRRRYGETAAQQCRPARPVGRTIGRCP